MIVPGVLLAVSHLCIHANDKLHARYKVLGWAMLIAIILPSLQTDYLYFSTGYGHRDRLNEAIEYIRDRKLEGDQILWLSALRYPEEPLFNFKTSARLAGLSLKKDQIILPASPQDIDLSKRIWVVGWHRVPPDATGFDKWISDHTRLVAEFNAHKGPIDHSIRVYLHSPESFMNRKSVEGRRGNKRNGVKPRS